MFGFSPRAARLYRVYLVSLGLLGFLLAAPAATRVDGCCDFECPWNAPACDDPCDYDTDYVGYVDSSCESNCCLWGSCFIKERYEPSGPCVYVCQADQYAECAAFPESCGV